MKISIILLDWSVRESFHAIEYLNKQTAERNSYELIWVEYFDRKVSALEKYYNEGRLDKYLILGNKAGAYKKHEAWNIGVSQSSGDIVVLCDSDAIFKQSFVRSVLDFFEPNINSFLMIDEIRSENKSFWPFSYPSWEEVLSAPGIVNWNDKYHVTNGLAPEYKELPIWQKMFVRNYGACLCVKKTDYIRYGGLDEHDSYEGYICGPYDLVVRMVNGGLKECWHDSEFLLHSYHPRVNPGIDRVGPNVLQNSITSFKHLFDRDTMPYVENKAIRALRKKMYGELPEGELPKVSIVVPKARPSFIQSLYDSVKGSTKLPYEVIFIGEEDYETVEECMTYIKFRGSLYDSIIKGCLNSRGESIAIVHPQAFFRRYALDRLLDFQRLFSYPIVCLNVLETFTQGFIWQYCNSLSFGNEVWRPVVFDRSVINCSLTNMGLSKLFYGGKKLGSAFELPIHLEVWHDYAGTEDKALQLILNQMLELDSKSEKLAAAKRILDQICEAEKNTPGSFLRYLYIKRYSLREYYNFIAIFHKNNRNEEAVKGFRLVTDCSAILTSNINENIKEAAWLHKMLYSELANFIGTAYFNQAVYAFEKNQREDAAAYLASCLSFVPNHEAAKAAVAQQFGSCCSGGADGGALGTL